MAVPNFAVRNLIFGLLEAFFVFLLAYLFQTQSLDIALGFSMFILNLWSFILVALGLVLIITIIYGTMRNKMEKNSSIGLLMGFYGVLSLFLSSSILLGILPTSIEITYTSIVVFIGGLGLIINRFVFSHFLEQ